MDTPEFKILDLRDHAGESMRYSSMSLKTVHGSDKDPGRFFKGVLNANTVDRQGERFEPKGIDTRAFMKAGGPVLVEHFGEVTRDGQSSVVARVLSLAKPDEGLIIKRAEFDVDPLSEHWMGKVHRGFVRGMSAGLLRRKSELRESKGGEQHVVVTESELIHAVLTTQPVSRESLIVAKSSDRIAVLEASLKDLSSRLGVDSGEILEELSVKIAELSEQVASLSERFDDPSSGEGNGGMLREIADAAASLLDSAQKQAAPVGAC